MKLKRWPVEVRRTGTGGVESIDGLERSAFDVGPGLNFMATILRVMVKEPTALAVPERKITPSTRKNASSELRGWGKSSIPRRNGHGSDKSASSDKVLLSELSEVGTRGRIPGIDPMERSQGSIPPSGTLSLLGDKSDMYHTSEVRTLARNTDVTHVTNKFLDRGCGV